MAAVLYSKEKIRLSRLLFEAPGQGIRNKKAENFTRSFSMDNFFNLPALLADIAASGPKLPIPERLLCDFRHASGVLFGHSDW